MSQLEKLDDFVKKASEQFIPIGFVPTFFSKEKDVDGSHKFQKQTVLMNQEETLYLVQKESFDLATLSIEKTTFEGPYKMYTEYDLENL